MEREIASCRFDDVCYGKRLGVLLEQLSERMEGSIQFAGQDWAATNAAYRFFLFRQVAGRVELLKWWPQGVLKHPKTEVSDLADELE